jgi:rhomboid family GlyGly-CTERM serine protease
MNFMIAEDSPSSARVWLPPAVLVAISFLLQCGGEPLAAYLRYERSGIDHGQLWRLITGNLVHLGYWHLFLNALSVALLVALCPERASPVEWLKRVVLIGLGMSVGLYFFVPTLDTYVGLSGLVYGLFAYGFARQALQRDRIAIGALIFVAARIAWELIVGAPDSEQRLIGGGVAAESHLYGVIAAFLYGLAVGVIRPGGEPAIQHEGARK